MISKEQISEILNTNGLSRTIVSDYRALKNGRRKHKALTLCVDGRLKVIFKVFVGGKVSMETENLEKALGYFNQIKMD